MSKKEQDTAKKLSAKELQDIEDIKTIARTDAGKRFFWRYLSMTSVYETSFTGTSETFYKEGMRVVGLTMLRDVSTHAPKEYLKMIEQNMKG